MSAQAENVGQAAAEAQIRAADPAGSAWVAANAGSGKTRVLTERVARLLLAGARPERILCLTYTKAAAAEMRNRLFDMLGAWAMMEDAPLSAALSRLAGGAAPGDLDRARRLFAEALETPGGLKIQTIHALCDALLRRFPLEAGAPPGFRAMEDRERAEMIAAALDEIAAGPEFTAIADQAGEGTVQTLAEEAIGKKPLFRAPPAPEAIRAAFGLPEDAADEAAAQRASLRALDEDALRRMIAAYAAGTPPEREKSSALAAARADASDLAAALAKAFLTAKGEPRKSLATKAAKAAEPDWEALANHLVDLAQAAREAAAAARAADRAIRLAHFGAALVASYEARKAAAGALDFDDLVGKARALLTESAAAAWALYRLDGGVDHILVDEAQDTSPDQWAVIEALAQEFHAGESAREGERTLFVVGDEKQSIYSFQGAAPGAFDAMRGAFSARLEGAGKPLREEALLASFRSAPAILSAVDAVFAEEAADGLTAAGQPTEHRAFHAGRAGRVELWPLVEAEPDPPDPEPWTPVDLPSPRAPRLRLATAVADYVADMLERGERLPGGGRVIRPGDVMILLQNRAPMMGPIIRRLKTRGAPVAGADRLRLLDELAVKDLLALMRVAIARDDDLSLAALLRSPLFDVDEAALFDLAHDRGGRLWGAVQAAAARWPREAALLLEASKDADFLRPYEFLEKALIDNGGRQRLIARLGPAAEDGLDELLAQALAYEAQETPSLQGFLAWIEAGDVVIKREMEGEGGAVRVMTVHGAKGREAPVVILPDTMRAPAQGDARRRIEPLGAIPAWRGEAASEPEALAEARAASRAAAAAEHRRLLYVAMTRAEDVLIVAGAGKPEATNTWRALVEAGFDRLEGIWPVPAPKGLDGQCLIYETDGAPRPDEAGAAAAPLAPLATPWAAQRPAAPPAAPARRAASALLPHDPSFDGGGREPAVARAYGDAVHAALEGEAGPEEVARIAAAAPSLTPELAAEAAAEAARARILPEAALFFAPEAIAEAGVALEWDGGRVLGRIDRLAVTPDRVAFVDFKSDAAPPAPGQAPDAYLAQLAAYRAALAKIYPGREVEAHLLWTAIPRLDRLENAALDAALARAAS